jgi:hypothetical protein
MIIQREWSMAFVWNLLSEPQRGTLAPFLGDGTRVPEIVCGPPVESMRSVLLGASHLPLAVQAGLWCFWDFFEESHAIAQDLHTPEGSYWHAILHRREPDPSNAKYWLHKVGRHPVFNVVNHFCEQSHHKQYDPFAFVDRCEQAIVRSSDDSQIQAIQLAEMLALLSHGL